MTTINISLPEKLARLVDLESSRTGFASRSEFIRDLLRRYLLRRDGFEIFEKKDLAEIKLELAQSGKYREEFIESVVRGLSKSSVYGNRAAS